MFDNERTGTEEQEYDNTIGFRQSLRDILSEPPHHKITNNPPMVNNNFKFRAFDKLKKQMICDGYHVIGEVTIFGMIDQYVQENREGKGSLERYFDVVEMLYSGIKVKDGKELCQGDLVLLPDTESESVDVGIGVPMKVAETSINTFAIVEFRNGMFGFNVLERGELWEKGFVSFACTDWTNPDYTLSEELTEQIEIIANIYQDEEGILEDLKYKPENVLT